MVQIGESKNVLGVNSVRSIDILGNKRSSEAINVLSTDVRMIPVSSRLSDFELVDKGPSRLNWTLSYHCRPISIGCIPLMKTMEMNGGSLVNKIVCNSNLDGIPHIDRDCGTRPLSIDADEWSLISIWRSRHPTNAPSETSQGGSRWSDIR